MQSIDIESRLYTTEVKIDYVLNLLYEVQRYCFKMNGHIDFVESIGGVLNKSTKRRTTK